MAAHQKHEDVVRVLAHLGARLRVPDGRGFWCYCQDATTREQMRDICQSIIDEGGDPTPTTAASLAIRRRMLNAAALYHPRQPMWDRRWAVFSLSLLRGLSRARTTADSWYLMRVLTSSTVPDELLRLILEFL